MKKSFVISLFVFFTLPFVASSASVQCTTLASDLSRGSSGSSVLALQKYLYLSGFLSATPNGVFGPATLSAVKKFQMTHSITATGTVGPITRLAIQIKSCESVKMDPIPATSIVDTKPRSSTVITAPWEDTLLTIGKLSTIRWGNGMSLTDSLVLEAEDGTTRGYIAFFPGTGEEYIWDVGKVSVGDTTETVEPGKYRIRVQDKLKGKVSNDPKSGVFSISAPDLKISSITPETVSGNDKSSAVLFGSGFTKSTRVYLGSLNENPVNVLFVSPDGTILVFSVPTSVPKGLHRIVLRNSYGIVDNTLSIRIQ